MLTQAQTDFYQTHGFLRIPEVFTAAETEELSVELDRLVGPVDKTFHFCCNRLLQSIPTYPRP